MILTFTSFSLILKKASNSTNQKKLLESLVSFGIPKKIERLVKMTPEGAQAKVIVDGKISTSFGISIGWFVCHTVQPRSSQSPEKPGTKQHDFEQTNTNMWICR